MTRTQYAAAAGFAIVAVWTSAGLGDALLCVLGGAIVALALAVRTGDLDLAELQERFAERRDDQLDGRGSRVR